MTAKEIVGYMESQRDDAQREVLMRFFKTGKGEYGEGDEFLGIKVPETRQIAKLASDLPIEELPELLQNRWHEVRLCGLLIMVTKFERAATKRLANDADATRRRDDIIEMYLRYAPCANNWDLVDLSVIKTVGNWLLLPTFLGDPDRTVPAMYHDYKISELDSLASSDNLWLQRMSVVCTWKPSQQGDPSYCLRYAERHLNHSHDLMHKAVGWMLREMGKRVSEDLLRQFLDRHLHEMSRTTLRYAIEKLPPEERLYWLQR